MALRIRPAHKRVLLLLFAAYLLCSILVVAFDADRVTPSKTCALCFMNNSLSSAVGQVHIVAEIDLTKSYVHLSQETSRLNSSTLFSGLLYRGPPLTVSL